MVSQQNGGIWTYRQTEKKKAVTFIANLEIFFKLAGLFLFVRFMFLLLAPVKVGYRGNSILLLMSEQVVTEKLFAQFLPDTHSFSINQNIMTARNFKKCGDGEEHGEKWIYDFPKSISKKNEHKQPQWKFKICISIFPASKHYPALICHNHFHPIIIIYSVSEFCAAGHHSP